MAIQQKNPKNYNIEEVNVRDKDGNNKKLKIKKDGKQELQNATLVGINSINQIYTILEKIKNSGLRSSEIGQAVNKNIPELQINFKQLVDSLLAVDLWYPTDISISPGFRLVFQDGQINNNYNVKKNKNMIKRLLKNRGKDGYMFGDVMDELDKFWGKMNGVFGNKRLQQQGLYKKVIQPLYKGKSLEPFIAQKLISDLVKDA